MKNQKILCLLAALAISMTLLAQSESQPIIYAEKHIFKSKILDQERDITIKFPENYKNTDQKYSVHYVLDAEIIFNTYSSMVELKSKTEEIPPTIVVGISNIDRGFDLNPFKNGGKFLDFITTELIPFIDKNYRTNDNRLFTGYSMAGNFIIYALLTKPESFDMYLSGSPYNLHIYPESKMDSMLTSLKSKKSLYTSMGTSDREKHLGYYKDFCKQLEGKNSEMFDFKYELVPNRNHDNSIFIFWEDGLKYIFRDWNETERTN